MDIARRSSARGFKAKMLKSQNRLDLSRSLRWSRSSRKISKKCDQYSFLSPIFINTYNFFYILTLLLHNLQIKFWGAAVNNFYTTEHHIMWFRPFTTKPWFFRPTYYDRLKHEVSCQLQSSKHQHLTSSCSPHSLTKPNKTYIKTLQQNLKQNIEKRAYFFTR